MRLTLRTLLAYLDNTLEPQDAEILKAKLAESGFATQLVQRIRASLVNPNLSAPEPAAVAPVEEANTICEYLDSTLSAEQVAEIERACLESEAHLAEAAACHQILTMVLGKPAEVSPQLRRRVYELPDRELKDIPTAGSFSSIAIPGDPEHTFNSDLPTADPPPEGTDETPTLDSPPSVSGRTIDPSEPVTPVGPADSGVSDAPTRLREAGAVSGAGDGPAIAGMRSAESIQRSDLYGDSIRPSRITPWLVSLALAAVLLFALSQIFAPLMRKRTAQTGDDSIGAGEIEVAPEDAPPMVEIESAQDTEELSTAESLPSPDADSIDTAETIAPDPTPTESQMDSNETGAKVTEPEMATADTIDDSEPPVPDDLKSPPVDSAIGGVNDPVLKPFGSDVATSSAADDATTEVMRADKDDASPPEPDDEAMNPKGPDVDADEDASVKGRVAKVLSDSTLLVGRVRDGDWIRLKKDTVVGPGVAVTCAPLFQGHMTSEAGIDVLLVGATSVRWQDGNEDIDTTLSIDHGRVLIGSLSSDAAIGVRMGETVIGLRFAEPETVIAVTRFHQREPGFDPLKSENHRTNSSILVVQGDVELNDGRGPKVLSTGDQWKRVSDDSAAEVRATETMPPWIDDPDADQDEVYMLARDTLLELAAGDQPIVKSLLEATTFRRSEVAALAGRALLAMGIGEVYFGGDGLLSQPDQRNYWQDHYAALTETVDHSAAASAKLFEEVTAMMGADADTIIRLLVGFSQKQLEAGSDQMLVELLDSNSMAVRVLARENLRAITGIPLTFRAEQNNAIRRAPEIKKWKARLRKGDIRWQANP